MSWPEEMSFIANSSKMDRHKGKLEDTGGANSTFVHRQIYRRLVVLVGYYLENNMPQLVDIDCAI